MENFDRFVDRHTGLNNPDDLRSMLSTIGVDSVEELISQVIPSRSDSNSRCVCQSR